MKDIVLIELNKIINSDCMDIMKTIPDKYFNLAIVDPPYGINITSERMGGRKTIKPDKSKTWDNNIPNDDYFKELFRVSHNQIIWGGNYFKLPQSRYFAIWDKGETMHGRYFAECEFAWIRSGGTRIFKKNPNQNDRIHECQKPIDLYRWILHKYAKQGDKIIDTHSGSGSLACACHIEKYDFLAIEKDEYYYKVSCERLETLRNQGVLF